MSESLIVTLGLKDAGVNKQITAINKELRFLDKEFKIVNKSSKDFETSTEGLKNKLTYLEKKYETNSEKLKVYEQKVKDTKTAIVKKEEELQKLTSAENVNKKAVEKASKQLDRMKNALRDTERNIALTEAEMKNLSNETKSVNEALKKSQLENYTKKLKDMSNNLNSLGDRVKDFGGKISSLGGGLIKLSSPLMAFAGYSVKVSMDFEESMSNVQALSGATGEDLEKLTNKARDMGEKTSKSAKESADALGYMALAGWDTSQMLTGLEPILRLSEAAQSDLATTSDLVTDSMSSLGVEVGSLSRYLDIVAKSQSSANTTALDMLEAYIVAGGTFKNLNVSLEESATWISVLANRGKKGSEAGNALNSVLVNLTGGSSSAKGAMDELGVSAWDTDGKFIGIEETLKKLNQALATCTQEQKTNFESAIGGKTQLDTLQAMLSGLEEEYTTLKGTITDSDGALNNLAQTMQDNAKGNIVKLKSQIEGLGIQVGNYLLPHINDLIGHISDLVTWFGSLDESTQKNIIQYGLMTFAGGTLLKSVGSVTSGIGGLIKTGGSLISWATKFVTVSETASVATTGIASASALAGGSAGLGALVTGLGGVLVSAAPFVLGIGAIAGAGYGLYKTLITEVVPSVDMFGDIMGTTKVEVEKNCWQIKETQTAFAESTKEVLGAYLELDEEVKFTLDDLYINSTKVTQDTANSIIETYNQMGSSITTRLQEDKSADLEVLQNFLKDSTAISEEEKKTLVDNTTKSYDEQKQVIDDKTKQIKEILENASKENRELKEDERDKIKTLQDEMKDTAIQTLTETELETKTLLERMKANDERITAEQSSQHIKTLNEARDKAVETTNSEYDERIKTIIKLRDESKVISEEQADKLIQEATRQRDEIIQKAEETRSKAIETMKNMNSELENQVDLSTGRIRTKWDELKSWWDNWTPKVKNFFYKIVKGEKYNEDSGGSSGIQENNSLATSKIAVSRIAQSNLLARSTLDIPTFASTNLLARTTFDMPATFHTMQLSGGYYSSDTKQAKSIVGVNKGAENKTDNLLKEVVGLLKNNKNTSNNLTMNVNAVKQSPTEIFSEAKKFQRDLILGF